MTTPPPDKQPAVETLEEIAGRIARHSLDSERVSVTQFCDIVAAIVQALRNRDERAAKIAEAIQRRSRSLTAKNTAMTIAIAIREGRKS